MSADEQEILEPVSVKSLMRMVRKYAAYRERVHRADACDDRDAYADAHRRSVMQWTELESALKFLVESRP